MESTPTSGRPKPPVWIRLCVNLHEYNVCIWVWQYIREKNYLHIIKNISIFTNVFIMKIPAWSSVMSSVPWEALRFFPKEFNAFQESSVEMKRTKTVYCTEYECSNLNKCEKSTCDMIVTALHRLYHYFFSKYKQHSFL